MGGGSWDWGKHDNYRHFRGPGSPGTRVSVIIIHFFSFATKGTSQRKWTEADLPHHNCKVQVAADWHSMRSCSRARSLSPLSPPGKKGRRSSATPEELSRPKSRPFPQEGKRFSRGTPFLDSSKRTPSLCRTKRLCRISE